MAYPLWVPVGVNQDAPTRFLPDTNRIGGYIKAIGPSPSRQKWAPAHGYPQARKLRVGLSQVIRPHLLTKVYNRLTKTAMERPENKM